MGLGLAAGLAASSVLETLTVNAYFHMLFRVCLHLKARQRPELMPVRACCYF